MSTSKNSCGFIEYKFAEYCKRLTAFGMKEPAKRTASSLHQYFFKQTTQSTAFVVNLKASDDHIEIVYGYASIAFIKMTGSENELNDRGVADEDITIREKLTIFCESDEKTAERKIKKIYGDYLHTEKEDLLKLSKAKRKEFIQQIAGKLKPLGFRKENLSWTRSLDSDHNIKFNVQKSQFSDEYYFNIYIDNNSTNELKNCYYTRISPNGMCSMDWQLINKENFDYFFDSSVIPALEQIINLPLHELGKQPYIWSNCSCSRQECTCCWVEKNMWESKKN